MPTSPASKRSTRQSTQKEEKDAERSTDNIDDSGDEEAISDDSVRSPRNQSQSPDGRGNISGTSDDSFQSSQESSVRTEQHFPNMNRRGSPRGTPKSIYPNLQKFMKEGSPSPKGNNRSRERREIEGNVNNSRSVQNSLTGGFYKMSEPRKEEAGAMWWLVIGVVFFIAVVAIFLGQPAAKTQSPVGSTLSVFAQYKANISSLKKEFSSQKDHLWKTFMSSARHILDEPHSEYPSTIIMASRPQHAPVALCIAKQVTSAFESARGISHQAAVTDIDEFKHKAAATQKERLDNELQLAFQKNQRHAIVVDNLHSLAPEAALLLHGYCDGDNAPFKDVMMVLMLYMENPQSAPLVEEHVKQLWLKGLDEDKVGAIMSRVANNVVIVEGEPPQVVRKVCP